MSDRLVLVGESIADVTLATATELIKVRLGGVLHAARALWACGIPYDLAFYSPSYLDAATKKMAKELGAKRVVKIGDISGCPNVMLIGEAKEAGSQGYEHLLRGEISFTFESEALRALVGQRASVLIIGGNFDLVPVLRVLKRTRARVHFDLGNGPATLRTLSMLGRPLSTLFLSTSAKEFPKLAAKLPFSVAKLAGRNAECVVLKENRGGSRCFLSGGNSFEVGAQRKQIVHSVGVGDAFDAAFVALAPETGVEPALAYSSWIAAEYAATTFPRDFKRAVVRTLALSEEEVLNLPSVRLPWESRRATQIYVAAPDFDYVDTKPIDDLVACLKYHNFSPRRPVKENGQANKDLSITERQNLFQADMALIEKCEVMIAVLIFDDPGTLIEIGIAIQSGKPVLVYDPFLRARNIMLTQGPQLVSSSLDEIVTATFDEVARINSSQ